MIQSEDTLKNLGVEGGAGQSGPGFYVAIGSQIQHGGQGAWKHTNAPQKEPKYSLLLQIMQPFQHQMKE